MRAGAPSEMGTSSDKPHIFQATTEPIPPAICARPIAQWIKNAKRARCDGTGATSWMIGDVTVEAHVLGSDEPPQVQHGRVGKIGLARTVASDDALQISRD